MSSMQTSSPQDSTDDFVERLDSITGATVVHGMSFSDLTTLRIGSAPRAVVEVTTPGAVAAVVKEVVDAQVPWLVVGGGSNLVVGESSTVEEFIVVHLTVRQPILDDSDGDVAEVAPVMMDVHEGTVSCFGGVEWDALVAATVTSGLGGLECLSGIPGSVGATPVQNVGAYGVEVSSVLQRVLLTYCGVDGHVAGSQEWVTPDALDLSYRFSNLKFTRRAVVTAVEFRLTPGGMSAPLRFGELARRLGVTPDESSQDGVVRRPAAAVREAVLELRRSKGMVLDAEDHDTWSAGSFFTNPIIDADTLPLIHHAVREHCGDDVVDSMPVFPTGDGVKLSAAWLIDKSGLTKGWKVRDGAPASLSTKHTLALTNRGGARSADIAELAEAVRAHVRETFGVDLEPEPVWVGF
ncbi:UDP-N-acetylmuramate dehydrogenase [Corynebacterium kroppenstedtii]|uniref:UDP-N-acetylmuramate dehydrogenase n=1 Tax=Corynebacterium sp. PCR 32 TaxID=3351342 RepID=UPI0030B0C5CC